jgi:hypothetical protein
MPENNGKKGYWMLVCKYWQLLFYSLSKHMMLRSPGHGLHASPHGLNNHAHKAPHPLKTQVLILLLGGIFFFTGVVHTHADMDQMQLDILTHYELPLRWDNIEEEGACLVSGPDPGYSMEYGMHIITLDPGEAVKVKIPENTMLRVFSPDSCAPLDPLKFSISNGTGLHAFLTVPMTQDRLSALIVPQTDDPAMCRISLPAHAEGCLKIALFTSRQEPLDTLAPFRTLLPLAGEAVAITQKNTPGTKKFWHVNTDRPLGLNLEGPARIAIETRLLYPPLEQSRRIRYFLQVLMDAHPFATLNFETLPETSKKIFMDATPLVCGRVQSAILNIPQGAHTLKIHPRCDLIVRVLKQDDPDYLFSKFNAPESYGATRDRLMSPKSLNIPGDKTSNTTTSTPPTLCGIETIAQQMVRDNARPQGGLSGAFLMEQQAKKRPDAPFVKKVAKDLYAAHTFFRDLLPCTKPGIDSQKSFRFILPRLKRLQDHNMTVATQHADRLYSLVQESDFLKIPTNEARPLVYRFPRRTAPSRLRIMVSPQDVSQKFFIKFNNRHTQTEPKPPVLTTTKGLSTQNPESSTQYPAPNTQDQSPITFTVAPCYEAPSEAFRITPAEAGLALNMLRHRPGFHFKNSVPESEKHPCPPGQQLPAPSVSENKNTPSPHKPNGTVDKASPCKNCRYFDETALYLEPFIKPAFIELPLPTDVDGFTLWGENSAGMAAVQYLDSLPYRMSESEYLQAIKTAGPPQRLFTEFAAFLSSGQGRDDTATTLDGMVKNDLKSHWTPLVRMIRANDALFSAGQGRQLPEPSTGLSQARVTALTKKARDLEAHHQPLPALEKWSELFRNTTGKVRSDAAFKMVEQLILLGETYLAESLLKQLFLKSAPPVPEEAVQRLVSFYQKGGADKQLLPLYSARAVRYPTPDNFKILSEQLLKDEHFFHAMMLATTIPHPVKPTTVLLKTAGHLGWFKMYVDLVKKLRRPKDIAYWQGMKLLHQFEYDKACDLLENAAKKGETLKTAVVEGLAINDLIFSRDQEKRIQGILAWESWVANLPGDHNWQNASHGVLDYDGAVMVYSGPRDLYSKAFRATPLKPVKARFYGPLKLKVTARVLHGQHDTLPVNGWFSIKHNGTNHGVPIVNNLPVQGLTMVGEKDLLPGRSITQEIHLGPGVNEIEVDTRIPLIATFHMLRPVMPLAGILPELNMDTVEAVMKGNFKTTSGLLPNTPCNAILNDSLSFTPPHMRLQFFNRIIPRYSQNQLPSEPRHQSQSRYHSQGQSRDNHDLAPCNANCPVIVNIDAPLKNESSPQEDFSCNPPRHIRQSYFPIPPISWDALNSKRHGIPMEKKQNPPPHKEISGEKEKTFKKMTGLVKAAEENPENILSIEADARRLFSKHSHLPGLGPLLEKITIKTAWKPVSLVQANAGIVPFPMETWQPESDTLRVRKSLFPEIFMGEQVITKENDLVFFMSNIKPVIIKATVSPIDLSILQPAPVKFFYQIDDHPPEFVTLMPGFPDYQLSEHVSKGVHRLTLGIVESYSNQFLKVKFCEARSNAGTCADVELDQIPRRSFYMATHKDPVMVNVLGPAWIRIDQHKQEDTWTRYQYIEKGWQRLALTPDKNEKEALFRVHQRRVKNTDTGPKPIRPVRISYDSLPAPHGDFKSEKPVENIWFHDAYPLGSQEDGTWSLTASYKKPFSVQEDSDVESQDHQYEVSASHYYHDDALPGYFKTSFLSRFKEQGGPTLGVLEDFFYYPRQIPLGFNIKSSLYMQKPDAHSFDFFESGTGEYAGFVKARIFQKRSLGPKSFHIPSFSLFGRMLSMDDADEYPDHRVDSDVFSTYKNDHKAGAGLSEYTAFRPWLDTVWFLQGALNSNEDFNLFSPDNMKIQVGWKQLLGNLNANIKYRHAYYFSDDDRDNDIKRNHMDLDLLWNQWMPDQRRLSLGLELSQDLDNNESSILFSLSWFFSQGRGLKDIRPGELDFYTIHQRNIPQTNNNYIWSD